MNAIEIEGLTKIFDGRRAVDGLSLSVAQGELLALLGVNGAGKSTTIKMLSGVLRPDGGDAYIMGASVVSELQKVKPHINVSPQETAVAPNLSVFENLRLISGIYGADRAASCAAADGMISELGMESVTRQRAGTLSGGWQRRLSIAMALITKPQVLFLDEPTLGLDVLARRELWSEIEKLKGKMTVVLTTHYLEEAEALSDRVAVMSAGRLAAVGTADALKKQTGKANFEDAFIQLAAGGGTI
jgi:ABC-2 type transport system ATP-binding protein